MSTALQRLTIRVNGEEKFFPAPLTVDQLLLELGLRRELVAVEVNRDLVRRVEFVRHAVHDGDHLEIVEFVGGG
jgi:sulfur carrier protein